MRYQFGSSDDKFGKYLGDWYTKNSGSTLNNYYTTIGIYKDIKLEGVIIYTNFTETNADMHTYMPKCMCKFILREMFKYPFIDLKLYRITANVKSTNVNLIKILPRLGFILEATLEKYHNINEDALMYKMTKKEASKWIS